MTIFESPNFDRLRLEVLPDPLLEVSQFAPRKLQRIERVFRRFKEKEINITQFRKELAATIHEVTGIKQVVVFSDNNLNAAVVPIYNRLMPSNIFRVFHELGVGANLDALPPDQLKKLKKICAPDSIEVIYIIVGNPMVARFTPEQLTAVMLHELGHVFSRTSALPFFIFHTFRELFRMSFPISIFTAALFRVKELIPWITLLYFVGINGFAFVDKLGEYEADSFATKYGYGKEIMEVNKIFHEEYFGAAQAKQKSRSIWEFTKSLLKQIVSWLLDLMFPGEHPSSKNRMKRIKDEIENKYKSIYPDQKEFFAAIFNDIEKRTPESKD